MLLHNGRSGNDSIERKLDKVFSNNSWLEACQTMVATTLPRMCFDHHLLLVEASFSSLKFASNFKFMEMWTLHDFCR